MRTTLVLFLSLILWGCYDALVDFPLDDETREGLTYVDKIKGSWVGVKAESIEYDAGVKKTLSLPRHNGTMIIHPPTAAKPEELGVTNSPIVISDYFVIRGNKLLFKNTKDVTARVIKVDDKELVLTFYQILGPNYFIESSYHFSRPNSKLPGPVKPS